MPAFAAMLFLSIWFFAPVKTAEAGRFLPGECPRNKVLVYVDIPVLATENADQPYYAQVVFKNLRAQPEQYLHTRSDGWTHLSSGHFYFKPGDTAANCIRHGEYVFQIEYYRAKNQLLTDAFETPPINTKTFSAEFSIVAISGASEGYWSKPSILDRRNPHPYIFSFVAAVLLSAMILIILVIRIGPARRKP